MVSQAAPKNLLKLVAFLSVRERVVRASGSKLAVTNRGTSPSVAFVFSRVGSDRVRVNREVRKLPGPTRPDP